MFIYVYIHILGEKIDKSTHTRACIRTERQAHAEEQRLGENGNIRRKSCSEENYSRSSRRGEEAAAGSAET